jgi:S-adenosylmethionine hydrolase
MPDPIITLTTDFGEDSPYVAAMKGVILGINPAVRLIDLSHQIPPQDLKHAAFFLSESVPCFPPDVIHVVVVDPGVGSGRALLYVEVDGHRLLAPDNGCWTLIRGTPEQVIRLTNARYWRTQVSATFHGRDILAPTAAHLSLGIDPAALGPVVTQWERLDIPTPPPLPDGVAGEVIFVDHFGNLITNIPSNFLEHQPTQLTVGRRIGLEFLCSRTYADFEPGKLIVLVSSSGYVEVAIVQGNAASHLSAIVGDSVLLRW